MIKKKLNAVTECLEDGLRSVLGRITPDGRVVIILIMFFLFGGGSIYMTVSSIYNMGKEKGQQVQIDHIERLRLQHEQHADSINHKNNLNYE